MNRRFRKSDSKAHGSGVSRDEPPVPPRLPAASVKLLRRCRIVLVKDLDDVVDVLRQLPDDDGLGADQRAAIASLPDRQRQAAALLDALELAGPSTFGAFVGVLRDQHRQLHSVLDETRHSLRDDEDLEDGDPGRERAAVAGESVRRLLRRLDRARAADDASSSAGGRAASTGSQVTLID